MKKLPLIIITLLMITALSAEGEVTVRFHNFPWGTSMEEFKVRMGNPAHTDTFNGLQSLIYENISMSGYRAFMVAYFSPSGLEGGTYYFDTSNLEELMNCYTDIQRDIVRQYGETMLYEVLLRELRLYESSWNLPTGYIYLKTNTRWHDPVTLWFSSPALTRLLRGS